MNRVLTNLPYGAGQIENPLDAVNKHVFVAQHYTNSKGDVYHEGNIVSITSITIPNPNDPRMPPIAARRKEMFNQA